MRMTDVISIGKSYLALGILCAVVIVALVFVGYKFIYQRKMKGQKKLSWIKLLWLVAMICYLLVVCGATLLRVGDFYHGMQMQPLFASYREAWAEFAVRDWRNLILNILMFVPFGFLLPVGIRKMRVFWRTYLCGFIVTLGIEVIQLVSGKGIFEWDDILNNTVGTMIGYGIFSIVYALWQSVTDFYDSGIEKQRKITLEASKIRKNGLRKKTKVICCQIPLIIVCAAFAAMFLIYQKQEFGNLTIQYVTKIPSSDLQVHTEQSYSDTASEADIFYIDQLDQKQTKERVQAFFENLGDQIDDSRTDLYDETAVYYSENEKGFWMDYNGGTYSYTDYETLYAEDESEGESIVKPVTDADESEVRTVLETYEIQLPEGAVFENQGDGSYAFSCTQVVSGQTIYDGALTCQLYSNGKMGTITNNIYKGTYVKSCPIISEEAAYEQIKQGKMHFYEDGTASYDITVGNVCLVYQKDSKGYYQPVYQFDAVINGEGANIWIAALKH